MERWFPALFVLALFLWCATSVVAQEASAPKPGPSLAEIRAKLFGQAGQPGLVAAPGPFDLGFERIALTAQDLPQLLSLVEELKDLPPRAEVILRGQVDGIPFKVKRERTRSGNLEAKLEGLRFADREQFLSVASMLLRQGVKEFKLEGLIGNRKAELKFEEGSPPAQVSGEPLKPSQ